MRFVVAVILATALVASACGGDSPTSPTAPPVVNPPAPAPAPVTASLSGLSDEAREYVQKATLSTSVVQRIADRQDSNPVRIFVGPYSETLVARAIGFWEARLPLRFRTVTIAGEGEITLVNELPETSSLTACGGASIVGGPLPVIAGGRARIAVGLRPGCLDQGNTLVVIITHEIGHILGFGHTADFKDLMSPQGWGFVGSPTLDEAVRWIYSAPVGAKVVP